MHPDPLLCAGLAAALRQHTDIKVFVHGMDDLPLADLRVNVVIADYGNAMRLMDGEALQPLGLSADARILALTSNDREADIRRAIEAGVHGYLLVGGPLDELVDAVRAVARGMRYVSLSVAQRVADSLTRATLTSREIEVLTLVTAGEPNKVIARRLNISLGTVKSHVSAVMTKLGASSRTEAARISVARGLVVDPSEPDPKYLRPRPRATVTRMQFA
jgi:DNA-binding NarL/FixJ family response regulator